MEEVQAAGISCKTLTPDEYIKNADEEHKEELDNLVEKLAEKINIKEMNPEQSEKIRNTSFVVTDPKGELLADTGRYLLEKGYIIKVLNMVNMKESDCYNPFQEIAENQEDDSVSCDDYEDESEDYGY